MFLCVCALIEALFPDVVHYLLMCVLIWDSEFVVHKAVDLFICTRIMNLLFLKLLLCAYLYQTGIMNLWFLAELVDLFIYTNLGLCILLFLELLSHAYVY